MRRSRFHIGAGGADRKYRFESVILRSLSSSNNNNSYNVDYQSANFSSSNVNFFLNYNNALNSLGGASTITAGSDFYVFFGRSFNGPKSIYKITTYLLRDVIKQGDNLNLNLVNVPNIGVGAINNNYATPTWNVTDFYGQWKLEDFMMTSSNSSTDPAIKLSGFSANTKTILLYSMYLQLWGV